MGAAHLSYNPSCLSYSVVGDKLCFKLHGSSYWLLLLGSRMGCCRHPLHRSLGLLATATSIQHLGFRQAGNIHRHRLSNWDSYIFNNAHKTVHVDELGMEKRPRKRYWITILIVLSISLYTAWHLQLNPQHIPLFLATTIVAIGFVVVMALLPKYRMRFVEKIVAYHDKEKSLGALYRYKNVALALILINSLIFSVLWRYKLIPSQYVSLYAIAFLLINLTSGAILIAGMLKTMGKWVLLLMAIGSVIAILRILTWSR